MLPCRIGSPDRSTPGALPYQTPTAPSTFRPWPGTSIWLPQTAVAASSSLTPGTNVNPAVSRSSAADLASVWSRPPRGLPWYPDTNDAVRSPAAASAACCSTSSRTMACTPVSSTGPDPVR